MKILIIAAHPDDEILGCGGTLARYINEEKMLITLTDGESARGQNNFNRNIKTSSEICNLLNIKYFEYGSFPDNKMDTISLLEIIKFLEEKTLNFKPDIIFTHHPDCLNIDHSITYRAVITLFRPQSGNTHKILSFMIPSSTDYNPLNNFHGNTYIKLTEEHILLKRKCLEVYINEMRKYPHSRSIENIINISRVWGCEVGLEYCEKFQLIRDII